MSDYEAPLFGTFGTLDYVGDWPVCHFCGDAFESLAAHAWQAHGIRANEYKRKLGLPRSTALWSGRLRRIHHDHAKRRNVTGELKAIEPGGRPPLSKEWREHMGQGRKEYLDAHPEARRRLVKQGAEALRRITRPHGSKHPRAKLNEAQVAEIRRRYRDPSTTQGDLAREFGVSRSLIGLIIHRRVWQHDDA